MIGKEETIYLLHSFFQDCMAFWLREGKSDREAIELALNEISQVTHDPFTPAGDLIDHCAKQEYINKMKGEMP